MVPWLPLDVAVPVCCWETVNTRLPLALALPVCACEEDCVREADRERLGVGTTSLLKVAVELPEDVWLPDGVSVSEIVEVELWVTLDVMTWVAV